MKIRRRQVETSNSQGMRRQFLNMEKNIPFIKITKAGQGWMETGVVVEKLQLSVFMRACTHRLQKSLRGGLHFVLQGTELSGAGLVNAGQHVRRW